jgi:hypothetical protein
MTVQLLCCSKHQRGWSSVSNFKNYWQSLWVLNFWISKKDIDEWNVFSKKTHSSGMRFFHFKISSSNDSTANFSFWIVDIISGSHKFSVLHFQCLESLCICAGSVPAFRLQVYTLRYRCQLHFQFIFYQQLQFCFLHARIAQPIHIELIELIVNMKIIKFNKLISFMSMWSSLFRNHCFWPEFTWFFNACSWKIPSRTLLKT